MSNLYLLYWNLGIAIRANVADAEIFFKKIVFPGTKSRENFYLSQGNILSAHKCLKYNNNLGLCNLSLAPRIFVSMYI